MHPVACAEQAIRRSGNYGRRKFLVRFAHRASRRRGQAQCCPVRTELASDQPIRCPALLHRPVSRRARPCYKARHAALRDWVAHQARTRSLEIFQADKPRHRTLPRWAPSIPCVRNFRDRKNSDALQQLLHAASPQKWQRALCRNRPRENRLRCWPS